MKNLILLLSACFILFTACEEYEDYMYDYEFSATYFSVQRPVRTITESEDMGIQVGVALSGKRTNDADVIVEFEIQDSLLNGTTYTLLPESYYSLSDTSQMIVPKGEFLGLIDVKINEEAFMSDPLAHDYTYALPLRITSTMADSTLANPVSPWDGKDYTIVVIKYINSMHGYYYHKGDEFIFNAAGEAIDTLEYNNEEIVRNEVWDVVTAGNDSVVVNGIGGNTNNNYQMAIVRDETGAIKVEGIAGAVIETIIDNGSSFDQSQQLFSLNYEFNDSEGNKHVVVEELIFRNDGIEYEEW